MGRMRYQKGDRMRLKPTKRVSGQRPDEIRRCSSLKLLGNQLAELEGS
jgi:hypothetical protein